jgi:hypothetical protein
MKKLFWLVLVFVVGGFVNPVRIFAADCNSATCDCSAPKTIRTLVSCNPDECDLGPTVVNGLNGRFCVPKLTTGCNAVICNCLAKTIKIPSCSSIDCDLGIVSVNGQYGHWCAPLLSSSGGGGGDVLKDPPKTWLPGFSDGFGLPTVAANFLEEKLVPFVVSLLIFGVIALSLIFTMVGGIMYMTSGGNKEGAAKAKNTITYALVGLAVGLGAFLISKILFTFLGM